MHWLLFCLSRIRTLLWRLWTGLRWLPRVRHGRGWRSAILSRPRLLVGPHLLRVGPGALVAQGRLDSRPLCSERIISRAVPSASGRAKRSAAASTGRTCLAPLAQKAFISVVTHHFRTHRNLSGSGRGVVTRSAEPASSAPNGNGRPSPDSPVRSGRFYGN
jgi:hypothetical protein